MKNYKAMIFDIDGTLLDTARMNLIPLIEILQKEQQIVYKYEELLPFVAYSGIVTLQKLGIPEDKIERVLHAWIELIQMSGIVSTPFDGIIDTLMILRSHGMRMGIVSSKEHRQYEFDVEGNQMGHFFESKVLAEDTKLHKPHPDPLLKCLEEMQLHPKDVLYIGDTDADAKCASASDCDFAYATWGPLPLDEKATYRLEKPEDILNLLHE